MNKKHLVAILFLVKIFVFFGITHLHPPKLVNKVLADTIVQTELNTSLIKDKDSLPLGLIQLQVAYPDFIDSVGSNYLIWKDGTKLVFDDGKEKTSYETILNDADLQDQMELKYPKGEIYKIPHINFDPGRIRNEAFFKMMYGNSLKEVNENLVTIMWLPNTVNKHLQVTRINGVDIKLIAISEELDNIPHLNKYLNNPGGSFYWRNISGTQRLSMHSFGIAIDINVNHSNYWMWSGQQNADSIPYVNRVPLEIVAIFEKYGFIWGGKWYHYDTMHFEYRPELLVEL
jgi:peptidoglycan LD-endopeptidase CwlK